MKRLLALLATLALMMVSVASVAAQAAPSQVPVDPQEGCDFYDETGHNLCGVFQDYWHANGGLPVFGYPITEAFPEENWDTGETYTVQYFERERMEHHTALAGSVYEVLLGRLGNEVLLAQDRDWLDFEKSDPGEDNYFAETGFAVPDQFLAYWSSHGLDFGDEGYSIRESLALFGYPISQAAMETNMAGHTVLTQWFERARFEYHPDNETEHQVLLGLLGVEILADDEPPPPPEPDFTVLAAGLNNPRHVTVGPDGALYVALAGNGGDECVVIAEDPETGEDISICIGNSGSIVRIADGEVEEIATGLPSYTGGAGGEDSTGVHDVAVTGDGEIYAVIGLGADPAARDALGDVAEGFGLLVQIHEDGTWTEVADIAAYEGEANPEPAAIDSNPYSLIIEGENFIVVDAGGNTLLQVTPEGEISTLAVFGPQMVPAPPFLGLPEGAEMPQESVPTSVVKGPDGAYYVGELTGFPFTQDTARVWRVMPGEEPEVLTTGFTNIADLAFDGDGNLFVLEMIAGGLLSANPEDPSTAASAVTMIAPDDTQTTLATAGLIFSTGLAIGPDGSIYASNLSVIPGAGQVVLLNERAAPVPGPELVLTTVAENLDAPLHASTGGDGAIYIAESGSAADECVVVDVDPETGEDIEACFGLGGAITRIDASGAERIVTGLPAPADVHVTEAGEMYVVFGLGGSPETRALFESADAAALGTLARIEEDGSWTIIADLAQYEADNNPDPTMVDSNPYALTMDGENFLVIDAGGNDLLQVTPDGEISTLAVFEAQMVPAPPFLGLPEGAEMPQESVPTDVEVGPDGAYYVSELTGFPGTVGTARIWRVTPEGETEVYADGFTAIGALDFDSEGNLYVLEIASGGWLAAEMAGEEDPEAAASAVYTVAADGTQELYLDEGIYFATGLAIDGDDNVYIVNMSVMPTAHAVRVEWVIPE